MEHSNVFRDKIMARLFKSNRVTPDSVAQQIVTSCYPDKIKAIKELRTVSQDHPDWLNAKTSHYDCDFGGFKCFGLAYSKNLIEKYWK